MSITHQRLFEGIIATLRADVIPHIADAYARGQAVGVIDVLNNLMPRVEWTRAPLLERIRAKQDLLHAVNARLPAVDPPPELAIGPDTGSEELECMLGTLDARICDAIAIAAAASADATGAEALALIRAAMHAELMDDIGKTRKPLFAEIAAGSGNTDAGPAG